MNAETVKIQSQASNMSNANTPQEMMEAAMRRAEMHTMQLASEVRFRENMALFEKVSPDLYQIYSNYTPKELRLSWDKDGYLNLVNHQLNNRPVYAENPGDFAKKQVEQFIEKPHATAINFGTSKVPDPRQIHPQIINRLVTETKPFNDNIKARCDVPIPTLLVCGVGLGYHIHLLTKQLDIKNLIIFDPHKDSFYASLHVIDWRPILEYYCQEGKMIKLLIGADAEVGITELKLLTDKIGLHKLVYTFVYRHFNSKEEEEFYKRYIKEFHLSASGTGYLDDEQNGFAHTIRNLQVGTPLFKHTRVEQKLPPIILIGNGPSLDLHIDFLKENRNRVILMSCGTALGSLEKIGVKPDFHIEMERNYNLHDWLTIGTSQKFREGVTLLCLNTVSPAVIELFDEACMAKKVNDIGQTLIDDKVKGIDPLIMCNPTVTNAGLAFATGMGFTEIYLAGVDLGTPEDKHHSSLSIYHDVEKRTNRDDVTVLARKDNRYELKGNFGGTVISNYILDTTRVNMQLMIRHEKGHLPNLKVFNSNEGAFIDGTEPVRVSDIRKFDDIANKHAVVDEIKKRHVINYEKITLDEEYLKEHYLKDFFDVRKSLMIPKDIRTPDELYTILHTKLKPILERLNSHHITAMLLRGSMQGYFTMMMKICLFQKTPKQFKDSYQIIRKGYMEFLDRAYEKMRENPFKIDDNPDSILKDAYKEELAKKAGK